MFYALLLITMYCVLQDAVLSIHGENDYMFTTAEYAAKAQSQQLQEKESVSKLQATIEEIKQQLSHSKVMTSQVRGDGDATDEILETVKKLEAEVKKLEAEDAMQWQS